MNRRDGDLGGQLRALRKRHGLTLGELGARSGMDVSTLSKIENGRMALSYDKLRRIGSALDVALDDLVAGHGGGRAKPAVAATGTPGRRSIDRHGATPRVAGAGSSDEYRAADLLDKQLVPVVREVVSRSLEEAGAWLREPGEAFIYVLEGAVEVHTELYAPVRLECGDSLYFDSAMGHAYLAACAGACRMLSVRSGQ